MRRTLLASLLALPACTDGGSTTSVTDNPIAAAARGDQIVVAAAEATEQTGFGCGGGQATLGRSVLFVSGDRGQTFERIVPDDERPLMRIASRDGVFYALAHENDGAFGVLTSADGRTWTEVAGGNRYAQDLAVTDDLLVVAHATGVMTSPDGITWTDRDLGEGFWVASVARAAGTVALGTGADDFLRLSTDAVTWRNQRITGLTGIEQVFAHGDSLLVTGYTESGEGIARIDPASPTSTPTLLATRDYGPHSVLVPAGLLDMSGMLSTVSEISIGPRTPHTEAFQAAAVDGSTVVLVRARSISTSSDGGATFGATFELPIVELEIPATNEEFGEPRG